MACLTVAGAANKHRLHSWKTGIFFVYPQNSRFRGFYLYLHLETLLRTLQYDYPFSLLDAVLFLASFEADATDGLRYMHGVGVIHCDHTVDKALMCRSDGPTGLVGK